MEITFLGTGTSQGVPVIACKDSVCLSKDIRDNRLRSSVLIRKDNSVLVIDCGPDFRQQMLKEQVSRIDGVLFTHEHADHTAGLDDIRPFSHISGDVPIYAHQRVIDSLTRRFDYIFDPLNHYPGGPKVSVNVIKNEAFKINDISILPINANHGNIQVFGYRLKNFAYLTDVKRIEEKELVKLNDLDALVINALRIREHPTHFNLDEALELIEKVKPSKAYLTHISHKLGFHAEVEKELPKNVYLAYDGLKITV